ncbi:MAG: FecR domain-containing protein [Planctomycetota bacterium]|jgi:hypothetical protein|nr:FecR domain-containing protein [Planctomycetota bacterium]
MTPEFESLWLAYRADVLDAAGDRRLAELIATDAGARKQALADLEIEALLRTSAITDDAFVRATRARLAAHGDTARFVASLHPQLPARRRHGSTRRARRWPWLTTAVVVAAAALIALAMRLSSPAAPGLDPASSHPRSITLGPAQITFDDDCQYQLIDDALVVSSGGLTCSVEPGHGGFALRTSHATFAVLGTRFRIETDAHTSAVAVEHGSVRVTRNDGARLLVEAGLHCSFTQDGPLIPSLNREACALIIGSASKPASSNQLGAVLRRDGWQVLITNDTDLDTIPSAVDLIIPLQTARSSRLDDPSQGWHQLPVLNLDPSVNRWLGISADRDDDYLDDPGGAIAVPDTDATWFAGLTGTVQVQSANRPLYWADPLPKAQILARVAEHPQRACAILKPRSHTQAPRLFLGVNPVAEPSPAGWAIIRAAAAWLVSEHRRHESR